MNAMSLKESNIDPGLKDKLVINTDDVIKQKPPSINQDLTNKVFSNID